MIVTPCGRSWTASSMTRRCSSSVSVDASPVVPQTTKPSEPCSARWCSSATNASSSTSPSLVERRDDRGDDRCRGRPRAGHCPRRDVRRRRLAMQSTPTGTRARAGDRRGSLAAPDGDFAVLAARDRRGRGGHGHAARSADVHEGEAIEVARRVARAPQARLAVRTPSASGSRDAGRRGRAAGLPRRRSSTSGPRARRGCSSATAPRCWRSSTRDPRRAAARGPGHRPRRIGAAVDSWREQAALRALRLFLDEHGVPAAVRRARSTGRSAPGAIEQLQDDPYALTRASTGSASRRPTRWRRRSACRPTHPARLDAGVMHALALAEDDGHCHLPRAELAERARRLLGADADDRIDGLAASGGRVEVDGDRVARAARGRAIERRLAGACASSLARRRRSTLTCRRPAAARRLRAHRRRNGRPCTQALRSTACRSSPAARAPARRRRCARSSTCLRASGAVRAAVRADRQGRAAPGARPTGAEATTIHRLLECVARARASPATPATRSTGATCWSSTRRRCSSLRLADPLLDAVGPRTHVLLVGDVDQLAPGRPRPRPRRPDRLRRGPGDAADRDLPPGRALADRPRGPRDQPRRAAADRSPATTACATSS